MKYPAHGKYKASGVEWLGEVPAHWDVKRLRFACLSNPIKSELKYMQGDEKVSFVPMEAVGEYGGMILETEKELDAVYNGYTYFAENDVVVAKITPCFENGKGAIAKGLTNGVAFGTTELHVLRPLDGYSNRFLFYLSISQPFREIGASEMLGAGGQKRVPENFLKDFRIGIPDFSEQEHISDFLDKKTTQIDRLIEKKQALIEKLDEKRTAMITRAVTKGLDERVPMKDSGVEWLGEVPAHWHIKRLKFFANFKSGENITSTVIESDGEYPVYGGNGLRGYYHSFTHEGTLILIGRQGAHCGNVHLVEGQFWASEHAVVVTPVTEYDSYWFSQLLRVMNLNQYSISAAQPGLSVDQVKNLSVPCPPLPEQKSISKYLNQEINPKEKMKIQINDAIKKLMEYRTALITAAVTGKIKVSLRWH